MLHPSPGSRRAWPRALRHAGLFAAAAAMLGACASSSIEAGTGGAGGSAAGSGGHSGGGGAATGSGGVEATGGAPTVDAPVMDQSAGRDQTGGGDALGGCTDAAYILCEDFEATAVGAIPTGWTRQGAAALSTVTDAQAAHGRHALM